MNPRALKFLLLILIGWYVAGPVAESLDHWDGIRAETADIARSAGGAVTFVMAGLALAIALLRHLKARCAFLARALQGRFEPDAPAWCVPVAFSIATTSHSPPVPLRV